MPGGPSHSSSLLRSPLLQPLAQPAASQYRPQKPNRGVWPGDCEFLHLYCKALSVFLGKCFKRLCLKFCPDFGHILGWGHILKVQPSGTSQPC